MAIQKNYTIDGNGSNLYEMPEVYIYGSVSTTTGGYSITEVPPKTVGSKGYLMIKPKLNVGESLNINYQIVDESNPLREIEKNAFKETISNHALKEIIGILVEIIETQDNLKKELSERVTYSELDSAVTPVREEVKLIHKLLKIKQKQ